MKLYCVYNIKICLVMVIKSEKISCPRGQMTDVSCRQLGFTTAHLSTQDGSKYSVIGSSLKRVYLPIYPA